VGIGTTSPATKLEVAGAITLHETTEPATPAANSAVLFLVDDGDGTQSLKVKFYSGFVATIAGD